MPSYGAIVSKHRRRLSSILSPDELAIYQAVGVRRLNALEAELKARVDRIPELRALLEKQTIELEALRIALRSLALHERMKLSDHMLTNYCRVETLPNGKTFAYWPTGSSLGAITECVHNYLKFTRKRVRRPRVGRGFKRFTLFDKRVPTVQLVDQLNELVGRALNCLGKGAQVHKARPLLFWLWLIGHPRVKELLRFDASARSAVNQTEKDLTSQRVQAKRERARKRQARCRISVTG
jgi:hypothetical protein